MCFTVLRLYFGKTNWWPSVWNWKPFLKATRLLGNEINYTRKVQLGVTKHIIDPKDEQIVSAATEEQSASAEEIAAASEALATLAQSQQEVLSHFRF